MVRRGSRSSRLALLVLTGYSIALAATASRTRADDTRWRQADGRLLQQSGQAHRLLRAGADTNSILDTRVVAGLAPRRWTRRLWQRLRTSGESEEDQQWYVVFAAGCSTADIDKVAFETGVPLASFFIPNALGSDAGARLFVANETDALRVAAHAGICSVRPGSTEGASDAPC